MSELLYDVVNFITPKRNLHMMTSKSCQLIKLNENDDGVY